MDSKDLIQQYLFENNSLNLLKVQNIVNDSINKFDFGELFLEYVESESLVYDDNNLRSSSFNINSGFGLRGVKDESVFYTHSSDISEESLKKCANILSNSSKECSINVNSYKNNLKLSSLYSNINPLTKTDFNTKLNVLKKIDNYIRNKCEIVKQVTVSIANSWQLVAIVKPGKDLSFDIRPLTRLNISVVVEKNSKLEGGSYGYGGRADISTYINDNMWKEAADDAIRQAQLLLEARDAPAGEMPVILSSGWPGVLLHEAVGHGLEGDFNRKKTSVFSDSLGKQVASKGVTIVDDGTIRERRGSINIDDEGNSSKYNVLIEDGILKGYMQDELNARLMNMDVTGNARRENFASQPYPRMTNTFMLPGNYKQEELISTVKKGVFAVNFSGGQVDITSGKFVFSSSEAYMIENGKVTYPIKGCTLIGNGLETMNKITMIADDLALDKGVGTCGKNGQSVPVGVGQPSLLISSMTVGGSSLK